MNQTRRIVFRENIEKVFYAGPQSSAGRLGDEDCSFPCNFGRSVVENRRRNSSNHEEREGHEGREGNRDGSSYGFSVGGVMYVPIQSA